MNQKGPVKFLVTGGTGFIGASLVRRLLKEGHFVTSLDNDSRGSASKFGTSEKNLKLVTGDIRDPKVVMDAAKGADSVIHLAYINGTEFFYQKPELVLDVALRGMINVVDACRANKIKHMVLASSSEVYQTPPTVPTDEAVPLSIPDVLNPRYSYGGGKILCELMAINYGRTGFDNVTIFRPHNVYGPAMGWEHVIPQFAVKTMKAMKEHPTGDLPFPIQGDGKQTRSFIYIEDFTDGLMKVIFEGKHLNLYHIGTMDEVSISDVASQVVGYFGRKIQLIKGPEAPGGTSRRCPDIAKLRTLGFNPQTTLKEGLQETLKWYKANTKI
jgi:nucleoside-diphosphate-sugar epimerase